VSTPENVVNRAADMAGCSNQTIGDIQQGTLLAQIALRHYMPCLEQLLRAAYWNFARRAAPMQLLGAVPGFGPGVPSGQNPPYGSRVVRPWTFEYALPIDCIAARFVPMGSDLPQSATPAGNYVMPSQAPPTTQNLPFQSPHQLIPARMLVANSTNYPMPISPETPPQQWWNTRGQSPNLRTVVLCNVPCAELVYTAFIPYPNLWDPLFEEAMCALLATYIALPCNPDKKEGRALRGEAIAIAKAAIGQARVRDGDEGWPSVERQAEWITARNRGTRYGGGSNFDGGGFGVLGYGWGSVVFGDGGPAY
jgi:hypothetical protein